MTEDSSTMNHALKSAVGYFLLVLVGTLLASVLGGAFGVVVAAVSPAMVTDLFSLEPSDGSPLRYAFSVGMIWGLFLGVAVSCFACLLAALLKMIRLRIEHRSRPAGG